MILLRSSAFFVLRSDFRTELWIPICNEYLREWVSAQCKSICVKSIYRKISPKMKIESWSTHPYVHGESAWKTFLELHRKKKGRKLNENGSALIQVCELPEILNWFEKTIFTSFLKTKLFTAAAELKATYQLKWVHELECLNKHLLKSVWDLRVLRGLDYAVLEAFYGFFFLLLNAVLLWSSRKKKKKGV